MTRFTYADASSWHDWQRGYRYGALYIFPPRGVIEYVDALQQQHDPTSASYCRAHISLSEPLRQPLDGAQIDELRAVHSRIEPFDIRYGPLRSLPPHPSVVYDVQPEEGSAGFVQPSMPPLPSRDLR